MVHFHIHTNGTDSESGTRKVVSPLVINSVWIGLGLLFWTGAVFLVIETIRGFEKL